MNTRKGKPAEQLDISQKNIRTKIHSYLSKSNRDPKIINAFTKGNGYCNGLASLAVYAQYLECCHQNNRLRIPQDNWRWVKSTLKKIAAWNEDLGSLSAQDRDDFDRLISLVKYFQDIADYMPFSQGNLHKFLEDTAHRHLSLEFTFGGLLTAADFSRPLQLQGDPSGKTTLFRELLKYQHRLILVSCGRHSLGLFRNGDRISLYNANDKAGRKFFSINELDKLAEAVFKAYKYNNHTPSPIGFRIFTFEQPQVYTHPEELLSALNGPISHSDTQTKIDYHALHIATRIGSDKCVKYFLGKNANLESKNLNGRTALYVAASRDYHNIVELLLTNGADINAKCADGKSPLIRAAQKGRMHIVKMMLKNGKHVTLSCLIDALSHLKTENDRRELVTSLGHDTLARMMKKKYSTERKLKEYESSKHYNKFTHDLLLELVLKYTSTKLDYQSNDLLLFSARKRKKYPSKNPSHQTSPDPLTRSIPVC